MANLLDIIFGGVIVQTPSESPVVVEMSVSATSGPTEFVETSVTSSQVAEADALLSARITSVGFLGGASVTSAKVAIASAAATSADFHANTVSAQGSERHC